MFVWFYIYSNSKRPFRCLDIYSKLHGTMLLSWYTTGYYATLMVDSMLPCMCPPTAPPAGGPTSSD